MTSRARLLAASAALFACPVLAQQPSAVADPARWPEASSPAAFSDAEAEAFIESLLSRMSVEEKVGQTVQGDISAITPDDLRRYPLGSILAGGNSGPGGDERATAAEWLDLIRRFRAVSVEQRPGHVPVPIIFGIDAVHGHANLPGATVFPHNIGLGAARDPDLIRRIGVATAAETAATGVDWTFAPTLAVPRDVRWGRSYEGYAEEPALVASYAAPMTIGLQGELVAGDPLAPGRVAATAKHFLADGGTVGGKDQGDAAIDEETLVRVHAAGYPPAIDAGALTVMVSFSSWNGAKHHGNRSLLTDVLKERMGFDGFVVGDWNAHGQIPGCTTTDCPEALNAGLDMYMAPDSWKGLFDSLVAQVKSGEVPMARLDDAVRRILRVKHKAGLFEPGRPFEGRFEVIGSPAHDALAREAVAKSLVLLKNNGVLPIRAGARVLVAGNGADSIGKASGGWTVTWQGTGTTNADFPGGQSIYRGIADAVAAGGGSAVLSEDGSYTDRPDVAIVVYGEDPYAEFQGDVPTLDYQPAGATDLAMLNKLKADGIPVVSVFLSGRPLWTNPEINASDAFVAAWLPGSQGTGVADVLVRKPDGGVNRDFSGKLSFTWPATAAADGEALFAYGHGLSYAKPGTVPTLSEDPGIDISAALNVDRYFAAGRALAPWTMSIADDGGARPAAGAPATSPAGTLSIRPVDLTAQEDGRQLAWTGAGNARVEIGGPTTDLNRQLTGAFALAVDWRIDERPTAPVLLSFGGATLDITKAIQGAAMGSVIETQVPLRCFAEAGADVTKVGTPFMLSTTGRLGISIAEITLEPITSAVTCPAPATP